MDIRRREVMAGRVSGGGNSNDVAINNGNVNDDAIGNDGVTTTTNDGVTTNNGNVNDGAINNTVTTTTVTKLTTWPVRCLCVALLCGGGGSWAAESMVDADWKPYMRVSGVSGNLNSIGSDTLNNLMTLWAEGFRREYPNVNIQVEGKGSGTVPPALIEGTAQLGPMSRAMKAKEMDAFESKFGYPATSMPVAVDALAVYVNKDNPTRCLNMTIVDAMFSNTRRRGHRERIVMWGQAGLRGAWRETRVSVYGRNSASGTYGFFKKRALKSGDYKNEVKEQPGSASVVQGVAEDRGGIGYSGIGYRASGVHAVSLSMAPGGDCYAPTFANASAGTYPLARMLRVYVNKAPGKPLPPLVGEFLKYVYSAGGQRVVIKDGYYPLPQRVIVRALAGGL